MLSFRKVSEGRYDDRGYTNESSIAYLQLQKPEEINSFLTYNYGKDDDRFPLLFLTEGQGARGSKEIGTVQWTWKTMGRLKFTDMVTYFNTSNTQPGINGSEFEVEFATHWFIEQHTLTAPDGTQVRIQKDLGESAHGYKYILKLTDPDPARYVALTNLAKGKYWALGASIVSQSYSKGNRANEMGPGKMTSQLEVYRYSKELAGNVTNAVVNYSFEQPGGGTTNLWINESMRQFNIANRVKNEERLWTAEYNRLPDGTIPLKDHDNGEPITRTAGMLQICRESNYDTYGEYLTLHKIERTIGDILDRDTADAGTKEVFLSGGKGFIRDFQDAIANDARNSGFLTPLGEKMIQDHGANLTYGRYFDQYKTPDGYIINVQYNGYFDKGTVAEMDKANGNLHPRTGLPLSSHRACLMDMSSHNGVQNIRLVHEKGRKYKAKVYKGMSDIPAAWGLGDTAMISTTVDMASLEIMGTVGLQVDDATKMALIECVL